MPVATKFGEVSIFSREFYLTPAESHISGAAVPVKEGMVAIGGGVTGHASPGIFITESYPSPDLKAWIVGGQDHLDRDDTILHGYAIGLRLRDPSGAWMSVDELRNRVHVVWSASGSYVSHPEVYTTTPWPSGVLVGGGFRIQCPIGAGNLAVASYPYREGWDAASKDHLSESPAYITACAVYLEDMLKFCNVPEYFVIHQVQADKQSDHLVEQPEEQATLPPTIGDGPPLEVLLTGGGAWVLPGGDAGNLLWQMEPFATAVDNQGYKGAATDHRVAEQAEIHTYALGIALEVRS